jgi:choline dehydrogenase-like flavoprotein
VDGDLRTFRVPNLSVVSTSCFPTGGGANPTFMLMAFALRAADWIATEMGQPLRPPRPCRT